MIKKITAIAVCLAMLTALVGCAMVEVVTERIYEPPDWENMEPEFPQSGGKIKYYYNRLTNTEKNAYVNILSELGNFKTKIEIPILTQNQLTSVFFALLYDNPEVFHLSRVCNLSQTGKRCYFNASYCMTKEEYEKKLTLLKAKVDEIASEITVGEDEFETELEIHDYVVQNCAYRNSTDETAKLEESTAYGALVNGFASCEGYAKAALMLFDKLGIESYLISGKSTNRTENMESHMWNAVKINDEYYNLDLTWNDPIKEDGTDEPRYIYFNITDEELSKTHSEYENANSCTAVTDNYYVRTDRLFEKYNKDTRAQIAVDLSDNINLGRMSLEIKFTEKETYDKAINGLFEDGQIYDILSNAALAATVEINTSKVSYIDNETFLVIEIVVLPA